MTQLFISILLLVVGLILLIKGADWLVEGSSSLARYYGISELIIGLTVVGFGTSLPEFTVNVFASVNGQAADIVTGNVIGSNIFNLLFILGITGLITPLIVQSSTVRKEIPISLIAIILLAFLANDTLLWNSNNNTISRLDGFFLLLLFIGFLYMIFRGIKLDKHLKFDTPTQHPKRKIIWLTVLGLATIIIGGNLMVDNAVIIAESMHISKKIIGLTIVAAGTSLPELATSIVAAKRNKLDLAVGNIIGSNIFNIAFTLGVSALIRPLDYNTEFNLDSLVLGIGTVLLLTAMFTGIKGKLDRWEAGILLTCYIGYIIYLVGKEF